MPNPDKILIVDDDPKIRRLLSISLAPLGYEITSASDGFQALELIEAEQFNTVLLDLKLPGPDGIEILKHIREQQVETEVIMITAHASLETAIEALQLGAYDYVVKPFQIDAVRSTVKRAVEKQHLKARLAAIHDLSREITLLPNVEQMVRAVLDIAGRVLEFETCKLWLVDDERDELYLPAVHGVEREATPRLPLGGERSIAVTVAGSGESLYVPNVQKDPRYAAMGTATRSELAVPLKLQDRVTGVLKVESAEEDAFDPEDEQLLSTLAAQAAVALENARRLYQAIEREQTGRQQAAETLQESEQKFRSIVEQSSDGILLIDEQGVVVEWNRSLEQISGLEQAETVGQFAWDIQFQLVPEEHKSPAVYQQIKTSILEFLETGEASLPSQQWEEQEIQRADGAHRFVQISSYPIETGRGVMLGSAIRDVTDRKQAEEKIWQRNLQLMALSEIGLAITSSLDLQKILTLIADLSIQLLDVEATSVLLYDKANDDLWFAAASGLGANLVIGQRLAMGQGIAGWAAQHEEPALAPDTSKDPRVFKGFDEEGIFIIRSALCVPLRSKDQIIGVLEATNKKRETFTQEDLWLLSSLAAPAVTAIENARLFENVRAGRERLQALSRRLVDVQEAERGRVARELHDETGQALSSLLLSLSLLEQNADDPVAVITRVNELEGLVDRTLENLHRLAMNLRPASLDHLGLVPALEHYVELFGHQHGIAAQFEAVELDDERLPPTVETALYRIVQEALTNVLRHAQATRVDVLLERRDDQIVTIIEDNGVGFDPQAAVKSSRMGLFGMRERAEMLGGAMAIESHVGAGTTVLVEIPNVKRDA